MAPKMYCTICNRETDDDCVLYCDIYATEDCIPIEDMKEEDDVQSN